MKCERRTYSCGIVVVFGSELSVEDFADDLAAAAKEAEASLASIYFCQESFEPEALVAALRKHAPWLKYVGSSTAGEITPAGYSEGQIIAILFPNDRFQASAILIENISTCSMDDVVARISDTRRDFEEGLENDAPSIFSVLLIDGLSRAEEAFTSALYWSLNNIPLIGGSAGDNLRFRETSLIMNGRVATDAAIVIFMHSEVPFRVFKTDNFVPTSHKLVVTASDPDSRTVTELNAEPAAKAYAEAIGIDPESLGPMSFASHPVVVRVGGDYYCRSIQKLNPDGSLSFFCAIDDGIVLTIAQPMGMVESTGEKLREIEEDLGGIDVLLGFDCVLRRLDAQNRQSFSALSALYREYNVSGFCTYGEQFRSMHLNQTLTGIAFGPGPAD
ncbi:FIST N-terminal domain-containing protein [Roseibium sp. Sym1]|uniref:FIST N-terminal domain-containing protein n=1 Tax=Roseibium sp. Sym1 TaxID=3016006 RepID=UPI0022B33A71|nr:FIST N-terminal domain-containing protein [Roseibium sp. Sym1]